MNETLLINLENQKSLWKKCPACGKKPGVIFWSTGRMMAQCSETCSNQHQAMIEYEPEENNFTKVMNNIRNAWNEGCLA